MRRAGLNQAAIGFRAKTGRAIAVLLAGPIDSPRAVRRLEVTLTAPDLPATAQPFHEVMELPWEKAIAAARKTEAAIEAVAAQAIKQLVREARTAGLDVTGIGVVGSQDRDLSAIGNPHIRAHAAEGILFRHVLATAAWLALGLRLRPDRVTASFTSSCRLAK